MRTMYDSDNAASIPGDASMVAYYLDIPASIPTPRPGVTYVRICRNPNTDDGDVLDVEDTPGCAWPPTVAPGWVQMRRAAGADPSVYMNESTWPQVRTAFANARVAEPHYWVAAYPGPGPVLYPGSVAHQYANPPGSGGHYDLSVVDDYWPGVDPEPQQQEVGDVKFFQVQIQGSDDWIASVDGNGVLHVGFLPDNDPTGTAWGDNIVTLPGGGVAGGNKPNSPCEVWVDNAHGKLNVWTYGANGDRFHWQYDIATNVWAGLSA